jgi:hypothetical protein
MLDRMPIHGEQIATALKCARCGELVRPLEDHRCREEEKDGEEEK